MDEDMEKKENVKEESPENSTDSKEDSPGSGETAPADNGNPESENTLADDVTQETDNSGTDEKTDTETGSAENKEDGSSATDEKNGTGTAADSAENKEDDLYDRLVADIAEKIANGEIVTSSGEEYTEELPAEADTPAVETAPELAADTGIGLLSVSEYETVTLFSDSNDSDYYVNRGYNASGSLVSDSNWYAYKNRIYLDTDVREYSFSSIRTQREPLRVYAFDSSGKFVLSKEFLSDGFITFPDTVSYILLSCLYAPSTRRPVITYQRLVQEETPGGNTGNPPSGGTVVSPVPFDEITLADMSVTDGLLLCILMVILFKCLFSYGRRIFS